MNFNVYVNKKTGESINRIAKSLHRSRSSVVAEALDEWLCRHERRQWPKNFFDFSPIEEVPDFKAQIIDFKPVQEMDLG